MTSTITTAFALLTSITAADVAEYKEAWMSTRDAQYFIAIERAGSDAVIAFLESQMD